MRTIEAADILDRINRLEEELESMRHSLKTSSSLKDLAGSWEDYRSEDGKSLEEIKKEIYSSRKEESRRFNA